MAIIYAPIPQRHHWASTKRVSFSSETIFSTETANHVRGSKHVAHEKDYNPQVLDSTQSPMVMARRRTKPMDYGFTWVFGVRLPTGPRGPRAHPPRSILKKGVSCGGSGDVNGSRMSSPEQDARVQCHANTAQAGGLRAAKEQPAGPRDEAEHFGELTAFQRRRRVGRTSRPGEYTLYGQRAPPLATETTECYQGKEENEEDEKRARRRTESPIGSGGMRLSLRDGSFHQRSRHWF